jgi:catechol 2,3-dioxygenase-like lactoylglutathione lyase family enzyme
MTLSGLHVAVHVADIDESSRFYRDELGLRPLDEPGTDLPAVWLVAANGLRLHLVDGEQADDADETVASPAPGRRVEPEGEARPGCTHVIRRATSTGANPGRPDRPDCSRNAGNDTAS